MSIKPGEDRSTLRERAEKALRESEARNAAIMEAALDSIITCDQQGRIVDFNPAAERMFGFSQQDVLGSDLADLIIPARLRAAHRAGMAHYMATGEGPVLRKRIEMPALRADGSEMQVELTIVPILTDGSRLFTAYVRDITQRRHGEEVMSERARLTALRADLSARLATAEPLRTVLQQCTELLVQHLGVALARYLDAEGSPAGVHAAGERGLVWPSRRRERRRGSRLCQDRPHRREAAAAPDQRRAERPRHQRPAMGKAGGHGRVRRVSADGRKPCGRRVDDVLPRNDIADRVQRAGPDRGRIGAVRRAQALGRGFAQERADRPVPRRSERRARPPVRLRKHAAAGSPLWRCRTSPTGAQSTCWTRKARGGGWR